MSDKYCKCCGTKVTGEEKFCVECGCLLADATTQEPVSIPKDTGRPVIGSFLHEGITNQLGKCVPADKTLCMLAEYIERTQGTVGADGYSEWVLNRRPDGSLQIDYYNNKVGYKEEIHKISPAPADLWDRILAVKNRYRLTESSGANSNGMPGGTQTVKLIENKAVIRLTFGNLTSEENRAFSQIRDLLTGRTG